MIRIHLSADDIARIRVASTPNFSSELVLAGRLLACGVRVERLAAWRRDLLRSRFADIAKLCDLFSPTMVPPVFDRTVRADPAATAAAVAATAPDTFGVYLSTLSRTRATTPFTRALGDGSQGAYAAMGRAVATFQAAALDPYRRQIAAFTAAAADQAGRYAAANGLGSLLRQLHPQIRFDGQVLRVDLDRDRDVVLDGRVLVLRPVVLTFRPDVLDALVADALELTYPATHATLVRDAETQNATYQALTALIGATRAAILTAIARRPAISTGVLAAQLGLSAASTSRQVTTLRDSGLISTHRSGMSVHHHLTRLGASLVNSIGIDGDRRSGPQPIS